MQELSILLGQINPKVGAIRDNADKIIDIIKQQQNNHDLIIFPELILSGYPAEDLLLRDDFQHQIDEAVRKITSVVDNCHVIVGHPYLVHEQLFNSASVLHQGKCLHLYHKQHLPNYGVFDEKRYFTHGEKKACVFKIKQRSFGLCICEDIWAPGPVEQIKDAGAEALICLNASPFHYEKYKHRETILKTHAKRGLATFYVNQTGGQDELVFDGQSMVFDAEGQLQARAPIFEETLFSVQLINNSIKAEIVPLPEEDELIYKALVFGLREYVAKNRFPGVLLGLSGGIDSALTLAIAVDAVGAENVHAVMMPSRFTSKISLEDALKQLKILNVSFSNFSIEPAFDSLLQTLAPTFKNLPFDSTEENLQARIRAVLLMAMSNKFGKLLISTSNKSETAVGYTTLYGDMSGGFAVLKDVYKTQVYKLAGYVNREKEIIPSRVFTRPPSAELAPNQTDQDSLPPYPELDEIITGFMEHNLSEHELVREGYDPVIVKRVIQLIMRNEYKRQQAAPGTKISPRAFGKDWRFPITSGAFQI